METHRAEHCINVQLFLEFTTPYVSFSQISPHFASAGMQSQYKESKTLGLERIPMFLFYIQNLRAKIQLKNMLTGYTVWCLN